MPDLNVKEIIAKAIAGNRFAFRELVENYQGLVYSIAYRFTASKAEAEDLTQETFIRVWKYLNKYDDRWEFKTWIAKITTNQCIDYLKSSRRKKEMASMSIEHSFDLATATIPDQQLEQQELQDMVIRLSKELTPKQQMVFILRDLENLSVEEVCTMAALTPEQVKSNLYHARTEMRIRLTHYYQTKSHELQRK